MIASKRIFGLAGWSGSGKTSLLARLVPEIKSGGHRVSTIKHAHHSFDIDQPGKDSYIHRKAGAYEVMVLSENRWVLMHENAGPADPDFDEAVARMSEVDLILVEGFKSYPHPKLEVHRASLGKPLLYDRDDKIVAVASDIPLPDVKVPVFDLADASTIAAFIVRHCGLDLANAESRS